MRAQYQYEGPLETGMKKEIMFVDYITFHYYSRGKQSQLFFKHPSIPFYADKLWFYLPLSTYATNSATTGII